MGTRDATRFAKATLALPGYDDKGLPHRLSPPLSFRKAKSGNPMHSEQRIASFIQSSFPSVWALELLRFLRENPSSPMTRQELVGRMRSSELIVDQCVASLTAAGLVSQDEEHIRYQPAAPGVEDLVAQSLDFYTKSPDAVRRMIVASSASQSNISAFADSFKFRKE